MIRRLLELAERAPGESEAMQELRALASGVLRPDFSALTPCQQKVALAMHAHFLSRGTWPTLKEIAAAVYKNHYTRAVEHHLRELVRLGVAVNDTDGSRARSIRLVFRGL